MEFEGDLEEEEEKEEEAVFTCGSITNQDPRKKRRLHMLNHSSVLTMINLEGGCARHATRTTTDPHQGSVRV